MPPRPSRADIEMSLASVAGGYASPLSDYLTPWRRETGRWSLLVLPGRDLREQLKPLASQRGIVEGETGDVPTRAVEPRGEALGDGVARLWKRKSAAVPSAKRFFSGLFRVIDGRQLCPVIRS